MDKSCHSSGDSNTSSNRDDYLNHLNKLSHKISKPIRKQPPFNHHHHQPAPPPPPPQPQPQPQSLPPHQQQHQPPVYNINKSDFRDVVQRLTGSPAHDRFAAPPPPPIHQLKPHSTRLQRIRPPPLVQVSSRPSPLLNNAGGGGGPPPLSPLPPFPAVHVAADSPISSYMRFLHNSIASLDSDPRRFLAEFTQPAPAISPRWFNPAPPPLQQQQNQFMMPPPPLSPMAFGCFPSPRSPYPSFSQGLLFSPTGGQLGFPPLSPRFPISSPRWKDH